MNENFSRNPLKAKSEPRKKQYPSVLVGELKIVEVDWATAGWVP